MKTIKLSQLTNLQIAALEGRNGACTKRIAEYVGGGWIIYPTPEDAEAQLREELIAVIRCPQGFAAVVSAQI